MIEIHQRDGHEIRIELIEVVTGKYRWTWVIDRVHRSKSRQVLLTQEVARSEALTYAQMAIVRHGRARVAEPT